MGDGLRLSGDGERRPRAAGATAAAAWGLVGVTKGKGRFTFELGEEEISMTDWSLSVLFGEGGWGQRLQAVPERTC